MIMLQHNLLSKTPPLTLFATPRLRPSGFWELNEKLWTPVEKSNWLISSLRLLSAMYDWEDRYTGASGETRRHHDTSHLPNIEFKMVIEDAVKYKTCQYIGITSILLAHFFSNHDIFLFSLERDLN